LFIANDLVSAGHEVQLIEQNPLVVERADASERGRVARRRRRAKSHRLGAKPVSSACGRRGPRRPATTKTTFVISVALQARVRCAAALVRLAASINPKNELALNENLGGVDLFGVDPAPSHHRAGRGGRVGRAGSSVILQFEGGNVPNSSEGDAGPRTPARSSTHAIKDLDNPRRERHDRRGPCAASHVVMARVGDNDLRSPATSGSPMVNRRTRKRTCRRILTGQVAGALLSRNSYIGLYITRCEWSARDDAFEVDPGGPGEMPRISWRRPKEQPRSSTALTIADRRFRAHRPPAARHDTNRAHLGPATRTGFAQLRSWSSAGTARVRTHHSERRS